MPSCFERGLELLVVLEVLFLADVVEPALELLVAEVIALLLAALQEQQLVDRVDEELRRDLVERLLQLLVVVRRSPACRSTPRSAGRIAAICRSSSSVLVKMSPFTFTRTCSMICARSGIGEREREDATRRSAHGLHMI